MSLNDTILSSIEAEIEVLKGTQNETVAAPIEVAAPVAEVPAKHANPILQMAIDQAAERLARETAK
jgi:ribosome-associated translation inhibitor RaiA